MLNFENSKAEFNRSVVNDNGHKIMAKATKIINDVGESFLELNGGELAEAQVRLAGYKFYLADYIGDLSREKERLLLEIKTIRANKWEEVSDEIKAKEGKVKNKEQIENHIHALTEEKQAYAILYESLYYNFKIKISAIDSILTAITQRISELKRQIEQQC